MSARQLWQILAAWRWTVLAMMLTCLAVALLAARTLPERYTARARVMLDLFNADPNQFMFVNNGSIGPYIGTQIRLVGEYEVTGQVVDKLGWLTDPSVADAWIKATGGTGELRRWAAARIADNSFAQSVGGSGILEIGYSATDPQFAAHVAGLLREAYIAQSLANRAAMADRSAKWSVVREAKAIAALRDGHTFRGLVTDINLGTGPDGWAVARIAREVTPGLPVVYLSGASGHQWTSHGVPQSVMVAKPFANTQVVVAIAGLLNTSDMPG